MALKHDTDAAIAFLQRWAPAGPWVLTSIVPDSPRVATDTFGPDGLKQMRLWIDVRQGKENIYFTVNPVRRALKSKAKKTDMERMEWLHVDIDPRAGEDHDEEQKRILKALERFQPAPTIIIFSGGGYQAFWRLAEAVPLAGDEAAANEAEAYNQQLEILLGGDHCHNVDRIMRLPGTINMPNEKKRKKGRKPALAKVVADEPSRVYELKQFVPAPRTQSGGGLASGGSTTPVRISGNLPRLGSVDDLGEKVSQRVKMLIVQGDDPDDPTRWGSRSECLFYVVCELVRSGCDDDTIACVLLDPDFGISASVLDKRRPEQYAARQIQQAREHAIDPMLMQLNSRHAVIGDDGGRCRIISIVQDEALGRERISRQSFDDFRNRYRHIKVPCGTDDKGRPIEKPAGSWWIDHPQRRQYDTIVFAPGRQTEGTFNLWTGFACEALPGSCELFLAHVRDNVCSGDEAHYEYMLSWMARAVQKPDRPGEVAVVLRGKQGTGKGLFAKAFGSLWGRHFLQVSDPKHLVGSFNAHLRDCVVLFGDEAFYAGDKKHESVLKMLITEETLAIEAKGVDVVASPNYTHLILASNSDWVIPAGAEERRFLVLDVAEQQMQNVGYFKAVRAELENGGREALLHMLLSRDISGFEVRKVPQTAALREQKQWSFSPEQLWWFEKLNDGVLMAVHDRWTHRVSREALQDDYLVWMQRHGYYQRRSAGTALGKYLRKVCPAGYPRKDREWINEEYNDSFGQPRSRRRRVWVYEFPELGLLRRGFDATQGGPYEWDMVKDDPDPGPALPPDGDGSPF